MLHRSWLAAMQQAPHEYTTDVAPRFCLCDILGPPKAHLIELSLGKKTVQASGAVPILPA